MTRAFRVLLSLLIAGTLLAQTTGSIRHEAAATIEIGTAKLHLGASRASISAILEAAGYTLVAYPDEKGMAKAAVIRKDSESFTAFKKANPAMPDSEAELLAAKVDDFGVLWFREGLLEEAAKKVSQDIQTGRDLARVLYDIVQRLKDEKSNDLCGLEARSHPPEDETYVDEVVVACKSRDGSRRTTIVRVVTNERLKSQFPVTVIQDLRR